MANNREEKEENPAHNNIGGQKGGDISGAPTDPPGGTGTPAAGTKSGKSGKGKPSRKTAGKMGGDISGAAREGSKRR